MTESEIKTGTEADLTDKSVRLEVIQKVFNMIVTMPKIGPGWRSLGARSREEFEGALMLAMFMNVELYRRDEPAESLEKMRKQASELVDLYKADCAAADKGISA